jgi:Ca2+-binding RTX toxin-like protein
VIVPNWLRGLRSRLQASSRRTSGSQRQSVCPVATDIDTLESRTLLTVLGFVNGFDLTVQADGGEMLIVQRDIASGNVQVLADGMPMPVVPGIQASSLQSLSIITDDFDDVIDLSRLTSTEFSALTSITVDTADGDDRITGSDDFAESVQAGDGADTLLGGGGNDTLDGGDGDDSIVGGNGRDLLLGGDGQDIINDQSLDVMTPVGEADNTIRGGDGDDVLTTGPGRDSVLGGSGADQINTGDGDDTVDGGTGNDTIFGGLGADSLLGGHNNDTVYGGNNDTLPGDGNDTIDGAGGDDLLFGEAGDDVINGSRGNDTINGGDGNDVLAGDHDEDVITGGAGDDVVRGGGGHDSLNGELGDDTIRGNSGNDTLFGGLGADALYGDTGNDLLDSSGLGAPLLSINDVSIVEGDVDFTGAPAMSSVVFTVSLSEPSVSTVSVAYTTLDVTATAGVDYVSVSSSLTFAPGEVQKSINVTVLGDIGLEQDETFVVNLSNPANAVFADSQGIATIIDDDVAAGARIDTSFARRRDPDSQAREWIVRVDGALTASVLSTETQTVVSVVPNFDDVYHVALPFEANTAEFVATLAGLSEVIDFYPLTSVQQSTRAVPNDTLYANQWHLNNTGQTGGMIGADANVESVWDTFRGAGVVIGIVDDGLQYTHPDLAANYDATLSFDFNFNDGDPLPDPAFDFHGTSVAGVAAGIGFNGLGISGAAPEATLAGLRLIAGPASDLLEATALTHEMQQIDIYNNSWGPADSGILAGPGPLTLQALQDAATTGRGGLGVIHLWAGGNGGDTTNDNVNYDGYANSRYTIAVGAINDSGVRSIYSDPGASLVVTAYSSDFRAGTPGITTTDLVGASGYDSTDYTNTFGGTSSATPLVAGVVALMLQANPALSYRDVTHVLANSARMTDPGNPDWTVNGAGHDINHNYGFGAVDAAAAVALAQTWTNVGSEVATSAASGNVSLTIPDGSLTGVSSTISINDDIRAEYVEVRFNATHTFRGDLEVILTSPDGTQSVLAQTRPNDPFPDYNDWTFTSARHWDELAQGDWTLAVRNPVSGDVGSFDDWTLNVYGTLNTGSLPLPASSPGVGTDGLGDTLDGGDGNDTLLAGGGNDVLLGGAGRDSLSGSSGDDLLSGGSGNDTLRGDAGDDTLDGESGNDVLDGGDGVDDILWSDRGDGVDVILDSFGGDTLTVQGSGASETYTVSAVSGLVRISEGSGSITASAQISRVELLTGEGNDTVTINSLTGVRPTVLVVDGQAGNDTISAADQTLPAQLLLSLNGGDDNDTITGGNGRDRINGGTGDDVLHGGLGADTVTGGDGNDQISGGAGNDSLNGGLGADTLLGEAGDDSLDGSFGNDFLDGDDGNDTVSGGFGDDLVRGDRGDDLLYGGQGDDSLFGSAGNDSLDGGDGNDKLRGGGGDDVIKGGDGDDRIEGDDGADTIDAGDGNDRVEAGHGLNVVFGGDGNDRLIGGKNEDTLLGGDGNDSLFGRNRSDVLFGGDGDDNLCGGDDSDQFNSGEGDNVIRDLEAGETDNQSLALPQSVLDALVLLNGF